MIRGRGLVEAADDNILTKEEQGHAYQWLSNWTKTESNIALFTSHQLTVFIIYEVNNRRRTYVVNRLLGRYAKVRRQNEWRQLQKIMEDKNARARDRAISMSTRQGKRGSSHQADLFRQQGAARSDVSTTEHDSLRGVEGSRQEALQVAKVVDRVDKISRS